MEKVILPFALYYQIIETLKIEIGLENFIFALQSLIRFRYQFAAGEKCFHSTSIEPFFIRICCC